MKKKNIIIILAIIVFIALVSILIINNQTNKKGNLISITYKEIQEKVNNKDSFILIVSQTTCSHCANFKPKVKTITKEYGIDVYYIDYDIEKEQATFLKDFNLDGATPTTLFIKDGKETSLLNRLEGDVSSTKIINSFKKMGFIK